MRKDFLNVIQFLSPWQPNSSIINYSLLLGGVGYQSQARVSRANGLAGACAHPAQRITAQQNDTFACPEFQACVRKLEKLPTPVSAT